jgi:SnoaL-like domain
MPWVPEVFTAPALQRLLDSREREAMVAVPYFDGLIAGEPDALVASFAGEPQLHDPVRGRVKGERAFRAYAAATSAWLAQRHARVEDIDHVVLEGRGFEEVVLHLDGGVELPFALVADRGRDGRIVELRIYHSCWPLTGRHAIRQPLLQPDVSVREADVVGGYQRALAAGDVDAAVDAFDPEGYAREPAGGRHVHADLRAFYERLFSNGGGIPLEHCSVIDDGRACALEYNVVQWGRTELPPQAGIGVHVRGESGKLVAARAYDDAEPPLA